MSVIQFHGLLFIPDKTKYKDGIAGLEMTPENFSRDYSVAIRIRPTEVRGWE